MVAEKMETDGKKQEMETRSGPDVAKAVITPLASLYIISGMLETGVKQKETRMGRVMRLCASVRKQLEPAMLRTFISTVLTEDVESKQFLAAHAEQVRKGGVLASARVTQHSVPCLFEGMGWISEQVGCPALHCTALRGVLKRTCLFVFGLKCDGGYFYCAGLSRRRCGDGQS